MTTAVAPGAALNAADRCDRCGAQAYVRAELDGGGQLFFCAHHAREHDEVLRKIAISIHDERSRLSDEPATAPDDEN